MNKRMLLGKVNFIRDKQIQEAEDLENEYI